MTRSEHRGAAIFGGFDGLVSVLGVIVGVLLRHGDRGLLVAAVSGAAVCATASMAAGEYLSSGGVRRAAVMGVGTLAGTVLPVLPFLLPLPLGASISAAALLVVVAVGLIAWARPESAARSLATTYGLLIVAVAVTVAVVTVIPDAAG